MVGGVVGFASERPENSIGQVNMNDTIDVHTEAVTVRSQNFAVSEALGVDQILAQVRLIQNVMSKVMVENEHYGRIPGCGEKKTLLQPGAQKLTMTFRLAPEYQIQESNLERGHKEYRVICTLKSIQSGSFVGQGVGCCSTLESKYRWRSANRRCPKCGKETIIKGKAEYGGGWLCFGKKGGCGFKWPDGAVEIESQSEAKVENDNPADHFNCVTPDTRVLTHDLQWVPAGEIESGDMLIGIEENASDPFGRHMAIGEATVHGRKIDQLYEVAFEDGRIVRCNGEHRWLVKKVGLKGSEWVSTEDIHKEIAERQGRPRHWSVMSLCQPWQEDASKEAGYVAGLLDADGSLGTTQIVVMFAQQENIVLSRIETFFRERGFATGKDVVKGDAALEKCFSKKHVFQLRIRGGLAEQIRALGSIRPPRLLERWLTLIDISKRRLEARYCPTAAPVRIASVTDIGEGEIVLLGTSCLTYFAEGFACHNTVLKMAKKRAFVDATITATAASDIFTQDIADDETDVQEDHPDTPKQTGTAKRDGAATTTPSALPEPTEAQRWKWVSLLKPLGQYALDYCYERGWLQPPSENDPGELIEALPLTCVPKTKRNADAILAEIQRRMDGDVGPSEDASGKLLASKTQGIDVSRHPSGDQKSLESNRGEELGHPDASLESEPEIVGTLEQVSEKSGTSKKGKWTLYGVRVGQDFWANTFDRTTGELAKKLKGEMVRVSYREGERGNELLALEKLKD